MTNENCAKPVDAKGRSKVTRFAVTGVPAAIVTMSLFMTMQHLVEVDDFSPPDHTVYDLEAYIDAGEPKDPDKRQLKPPRPDVIDPPPQPPNLVKDIKNVDMPFNGYAGVAPPDYGGAEFAPILPKRVNAIQIRDIQPITQPIPFYPRRAEEMELQGSCEVHFGVTKRGEPFNVSAECTHYLFENAARRAVEKVKFVPQIRDGLAVTVTGVVYPLEFRLEP